MLKTPLCRQLGIEYPIFSVGFGGGMAGPELTAAVSNAGACGVLGMGGVPALYIAKQVRRLREFADRVRRSAPGDAADEGLRNRISEVRSAYREALDDDLNLPQGVGLVFELVREANAALDADRVGADARDALLELISEFDVHLDVVRAEEPGLADEVERLISEREAARKARDFARSDQIRDELRQKGIALEDSKDGVRWRRVR